MPRSTRSPRTWRRPGRRPGTLLALVAAAAMSLAACGGAGQPTADDEPEPIEPADEPDEEDPDVEDEGSNGAQADGDGEHRPPDDLGDAADCAAIEQDAPGARIAFPSDADPAWLEAGPAPVTVVVVGCSNTFEANLEWEAFHDGDAEPAHSGFTMGGAYGDWARFSIEQTFTEPGQWTVVVFELDAESGERQEYDEVTLAVD